ncbi:hypothetical protein ABN584_26520 [Gloeocapsa sp. BRSZ]
MSTQATQIPFSAKLPSTRLHQPNAHPHANENICDRKPKEVEVMIHAARSFGRHGVRDAAIILLMFRHGQRRS